MAKNKEVGYWATAASRYDRFYSAPSSASRIKQQATLIINGTKMRREDTVLELGCGSGRYTREFVKTGAHVVANDISPDMIQLARSNSPDAVYFVSSATDLPLSGNRFDVVVGNSVLHHIADLDEVIQEIKRVSKKNARLFFLEPNMLNPVICLIKNVPPIKRLAGDSPDERAFTPSELKTAFYRNGILIQTMVFGFAVPGLPAPLIRIVTELNRILSRVPLVKNIGLTIAIFGTVHK